MSHRSFYLRGRIGGASLHVALRMFVRCCGVDLGTDALRQVTFEESCRQGAGPTVRHGKKTQQDIWGILGIWDLAGAFSLSCCHM